mgnify:FL=1
MKVPPFFNKSRDFAAHAVTRLTPTLIKYLADKETRKRFKYLSNNSFIDINEKKSTRSIRIARGNAVYMLDMIRSFDYYFNSTKSIRIKQSGHWRDIVDFSTPRFQSISGFLDFPIMCSSLTEPFITAQQYLDFAKLKPGDVVLDLGSYSSLTSIAFSKVVKGAGRVIALEPDPVNYKCCEINIAQHSRSNQLSNIDLINAAVSNSNSTLKFSSEGAMGSSAADIVGAYRGDVIEVPCLTLSEIARKCRLARVDFIKMDIEGSEQEVIESSKEFFEKYRPRIIIEPHMINRTLTDKAIISSLTDFGYKCSIIEQSGVNLPLVIGIPRI